MHISLPARRLGCSAKPRTSASSLLPTCRYSSDSVRKDSVQRVHSLVLQPCRQLSSRAAAAFLGSSLSQVSSCRVRPIRTRRSSYCCTAASLNPWMAAAVTATGLAAWLLGVRNKTATLHTGSSSFQQAVLTHCPTINAPYATYPLLNNGHVETIFAARLRQTPSVKYTRTILDMPDGGKVTLDQEELSQFQVPGQCLHFLHSPFVMLPGTSFAV